MCNLPKQVRGELAFGTDAGELGASPKSNPDFFANHLFDLTGSTDFTSWQFTFSACEVGVERHLLLYTTGRADGGNTDRSNRSAAEMHKGKIS